MTDFEKWLETLSDYNIEYAWNSAKQTKKAFLSGQTMLELKEYKLSCDFHYMPDESNTLLDYTEDERKQVEQIYSLFSDHMSRFKLRLMIELLNNELKKWEAKVNHD